MGCTSSDSDSTKAIAAKYENQLVRRPGNNAEDLKIYLITARVKHWIQHAEWIQAHGYHDVHLITASELDAIPTGKPIEEVANRSSSDSDSTKAIAAKYENQLVRRPGNNAEDSKIYLITAGMKRWIQHAEWIQAHGYHEVHPITASELDAIPAGRPIEQVK